MVTVGLSLYSGGAAVTVGLSLYSGGAAVTVGLHVTILDQEYYSGEIVPSLC